MKKSTPNALKVNQSYIPLIWASFSASFLGFLKAAPDGLGALFIIKYEKNVAKNNTLLIEEAGMRCPSPQHIQEQQCSVQQGSSIYVL